MRKHHSSKSDEPDLQESAFFKKILAYKRKLLVPANVVYLTVRAVIKQLSEVQRLMIKERSTLMEITERS